MKVITNVNAKKNPRREINIDEGMHECHVDRHLIQVIKGKPLERKSPKQEKTWIKFSKLLILKNRESCILDLVCHGFLGCLPIVCVVGQGDNKERTPEYQVGHRDHDEHFHLPVMK